MDHPALAEQLREAVSIPGGFQSSIAQGPAVGATRRKEGIGQVAKYLVLIYESEESWANAGQEGYDRAMKEHTESARATAKSFAAGMHSSRRPQRPRSGRTATAASRSPTGRSPRPRRPSAAINVIEADDLDGAIVVAKQVPARFGGVEVRPVMSFD